MTTSTDQQPSRPRVLVLGAGFAGVSAVKALRDAPVDITLIDRNGYITFQPLLYQVATGGLNPGDVTYATRALTARRPNIGFRRGDVAGIDAGSRTVTLDDDTTLGYDYLIVGTGVTANFFGVPGAEEHSLPLYTRAQALRVRDDIFSRLERLAQATADGKRNEDPTVVIVGAGATGVEMAGSLAEMGTAMRIAYPELEDRRARVVLVEMGPHVLAPYHRSLRDYTARSLERRGVELRLDTAVKAVDVDGVELDNGDRIRAGTVIWAAGVTAPDTVQKWGLPQGRGGRIEVERDLSVSGHPEVFVAGDLAADPDDPLPQLAQPAMQGGTHAARQIRRDLDGEPRQPFRYRDKGTMATIARGSAIAELRGNIRLRGTVAWLAWLGLHIYFLLGGRNRMVTLLNLSARYLSWPRNLNVIVGE
ncbi:MAG TPA: NAD(P)/FAD-dependent oxidoreductase [Nocardioidaceae bacterium]|nr:NAD(P)/FAD-dependent oxidoreductase [Nocardioidaceae bacterium]